MSYVQARRLRRFLFIKISLIVNYKNKYGQKKSIYQL